MTISVTTIPPDCKRRVLLFLTTSNKEYFYHQNAIVYHQNAICLSFFMQFTSFHPTPPSEHIHRKLASFASKLILPFAFIIAKKGDNTVK
jgi:hypothetical protein